MMKKKILPLLLAVVLLVMAALPAFAATDAPYIQDNAGVLTEDQRITVEIALQAFSDTAECDFIVITTSNRESNSELSDLSTLYFSAGYRPDGVILLLDMGSYQWEMARAGRCLEAIDDDDVTAIATEIVPYLSNEEYDQAFIRYGQLCSDEMTGSRGDGIITITDPGQSSETGTATAPLAEPEKPDTLELGVDDDGSLLYFNDGAGLVNVLQWPELEEKLQAISEDLGCDIAVVTTPSTGNRSPMEYADDYYDYSGFSDSGVVLMISMAERDWWISTKGSCINWIDSDYIGNAINDDLRGGDYYSAFVKYAELSESMIRSGQAGKRWKPSLSPVWIAVAVGVGLLVALIGTSVMKSKLKSVRTKTEANDYVRSGSLNITEANELYLYSHVSKTPRSSESRSGGGGGGVHISSSGSSHGGSGGKF